MRHSVCCLQTKHAIPTRTPIFDGMDLSIPPPLSLFGVHVQGHRHSSAVLFHQFRQGAAGFFGELFGSAGRRLPRVRLAEVCGRRVRLGLGRILVDAAVVVVVVVAVDQLHLLLVVRQLARPKLLGFDGNHRRSGRGLVLHSHGLRDRSYQ